MDMLTILALCVTIAQCIISLTVILNLFLFPKLTATPLTGEGASSNRGIKNLPGRGQIILSRATIDPTPSRKMSPYIHPHLQAHPSNDLPLISILIPARNESKVIARTITMLLNQSYANYELLILDDSSEDDTVVEAERAANGNPQFRLIQGQPLPTGCLGKNWACHQLAQAAKGDLLLFTDADVQWQPNALFSLFVMMTNESADMLTVWPTQSTITWGERLVVPLMAVAILGYLPVWPVHYTRWPIFAAANGQCLLFRRRAYEAIGGHTVVRTQIVEDVALAQTVKSKGFQLRMADGAGLIGCRMYTSWAEVCSGFAKNILEGHGNSVLFLLASASFHWAIFIFPWLWLLSSGSLWALVLVCIGIGIRASTAIFTGQRVMDALLMPLSALLMTLIAIQSIWWHWRGRPSWKGRTLTT